MNTHTARLVRPAMTSLCVVSLSMLAACGGGGGGGGGGGSASSASSPTPALTVSGTAATGTALSGTAITLTCAQGTATATADANGHYSITLVGIAPCLIAASANGTTLHSVAFAGGTFNTTPQTDLMLTYLAAQLGTTETGLTGGFATNTQFQQALVISTNVVDAESAVAGILQQHYGVTLSTQSFLTTSFTAGQPGIDADLDALGKTGAIDADGAPDPAAVSLMISAGAAKPLPVTPQPSSGGNGNTGGTSIGMM